LLEGNRSFMPSIDVPADRVITQYPLPNTTAERNSPVDLLISLGPADLKSPLPNLVGRALDDAKGNLAAWGLKVGRVLTRRDGTQAENTVLATRPPAYDQVGDGATIDLLVSSGNNPGNVSEEMLAKFEVKEAEPPAPSPGKSASATPPPPRIFVADENGSGMTPASSAPSDHLAPVTVPGPVGGDEPPPSGPPVQVADDRPKVPVRFVMPDGFMPKEVKFILVGPEGRQVLYQGIHKPNEPIRTDAPALPGAKLQIYINSIFIEERPL
jgi:hypothetical protein